MNTKRNNGGAHTMRFRFRSPAAVTFATDSGVDENGAASRPVVIEECTNPGRTMSR